MDIGEPFHGCKLAAFYGNAVLVYKRDDRPDIPFPGQWDLPGGGREGNETPEECVLRELEEEFSLRLYPHRLFQKRRYQEVKGERASYFFAVRIYASDVAVIRFGNEGQYWELMAVNKFLNHPLGVQRLKSRLQDCITAM